MTDLQILQELTSLFGDKMTLNQAKEALEQIRTTIEVLEDEGHSFSIEEVIKDMGEFAINEL